jgi:hypothetical protein
MFSSPPRSFIFDNDAFVVDRPAVEAEGLGLAVELARREPGAARGGERVGRGCGGEGGDGLLHLLGRSQHVLVVGVDQRRVVLRHRARRHRLCLRSAPPQTRCGHHCNPSLHTHLRVESEHQMTAGWRTETLWSAGWLNV